MSIQFSYQIPFRFKGAAKVKLLLRTLSAEEGFSIDNISIVFVSDEYLYDINVYYLSHDYYTDIITFDYSIDDTNVINGELYISLERAKENARRMNIPLNNELNRLIIHGMLHLCGYEDSDPISKKSMTNKEDLYLKFL